MNGTSSDGIVGGGHNREADAFNVRMRASAGDEHVSGAETIVVHDGSGDTEDVVASVAESMVERALKHPRGDPDDVTVTVERLSRPLRRVEALPVVTVDVADADEGRRVAQELLARAGVADDIQTCGFDVIEGDTARRGAALIDATDGSRLDPKPARGVRATHIGTSDACRDALKAMITEHGVTSAETVREAVVLATAIAHAPGTRAELCWSDDPDYDAGYVATPDAYYRFPALKPESATEGGRAIFVAPDEPVDEVIDCLEAQPILVDGVSGGRKVNSDALFGGGGFTDSSH